MTGLQKVMIAGTGTLLMAFDCFGIYTWIRVTHFIAYASSTHLKISQQSAMVRPFFLGAFAIGVVIFELYCRQLSKGWRFAYLVTLGVGAALLVAPWLIRLFSR